MNRIKFYEPEIVEQIKELREKGLNSVEIAEELSIMLKTVNEVMRKYPGKIN